MLIDLLNSVFSIGFSGDHILKNDALVFGASIFSGSYCSDGDILCTSISAPRTHHDFRTYGPGDTVGCGIDWTKNIYFFTHNGRKGGMIQLVAHIVLCVNS